MSLITQSERLKPFSTIYNFRDFGGYAGHEGRAVVTGKLFRSAHLNALSVDDQTSIGALPIGTIVDLRHAPERARQPSKQIPTSKRPETLTLPESLEPVGAKVAPHEAFMEAELNGPEDARRYMMNSYRTRPDDPAFQDVFRRTLKTLASDQPDDGAGLLVHCAAGKDRTGTLCALIQGLLGVSDDDIMADYLLTETAVNIDVLLEPAAAMFTQRYGRTISPDSIRPMFGVDADYLRASLEAMGPYEDYALNELGLEENKLELLRRNYLVT